jgi:PAS domain S-box-containing protein
MQFFKSGSEAPDGAAQVATSDSGRLQTVYAVHELLKEVGPGGVDLQALLPRILQVTLQAVGASSGSIVLVEGGRISHSWLLGFRDEAGGDSAFLGRAVSSGLAGYVMRHKQPALVDNTLSDERWLANEALLTSQQPRSAIAAPLIVQERAIGAVTENRPGAGQFDEEDALLVATIADTAAVFIENARLFEAAQRRATQMAALVAGAAAISRQLDVRDLMQSVAEHLTIITGADACLIHRWDENTGHFGLWAHFGIGRLVSADGEIAVSWRNSSTAEQPPLLRAVVKRRQPVQLRQDTPGIGLAERRRLATLNTEALLLAPMVAQDKTLGVVELANGSARVFSSSEVLLVETLANHAAVAVAKAELFAESQRQLKTARVLNEIGKVVNSTLDINAIMESVLVRLSELLSAEALTIALHDKATNELVIQAAAGAGRERTIGLKLPASQGVLGWSLRTQQPALVAETSREPRYNAYSDGRLGDEVQALICAPLTSQGEALGTVQAINPTSGHFGESDLQLLTSIANLASGAIANAQQFAQTLAAEARYSGLFEDSIDPMILTNRVGNIVEVNRRACQFFGYSREEFLKLEIGKLHPIETGLLGENAFKPIGEQVRVFTSRAITRTRSQIPVEVHAKRVVATQGDILQWIHHDISEQVELERMREDLTAMLFHDLQTPLGNITASLELVHKEIVKDTNGPLAKIVDIAMRSSQRLRVLIQSLLDINRLEAGLPLGERSFVPLRKLLVEAVDFVKPGLERRRITLKANTGRLAIAPFIDEDMIRRVLMNLLDNAIKYSPSDSAITVEVTEPLIDDKLIVSISDQGPGVPAEYRDSVFDKYRRLSATEGVRGMGIGLAFCRLAVAAHGGRIWLDDAPNGGARVNFTLPTERPADS